MILFIVICASCLWLVGMGCYRLGRRDEEKNQEEIRRRLMVALNAWDTYPGDYLDEDVR